MTRGMHYNNDSLIRNNCLKWIVPLASKQLLYCSNYVSFCYSSKTIIPRRTCLVGKRIYAYEYIYVNICIHVGIAFDNLYNASSDDAK